MALSVQCERCGRDFQLGDELAGQQVKCGCGHVIQVGEASPMMDFLDEELNTKAYHVLTETPAEWAKVTGAPPEVAEQIEKKMAKKLSSNPGFMMAVTGAVIALMLIIGLVAFLLARSKPAQEGARRARPTFTLDAGATIRGESRPSTTVAQL